MCPLQIESQSQRHYFSFFKSLETLSHCELGYCCLLQSFKAWLSFLWGWAFQKHQANTSSTRSATLSTFWKLIVFRALQIEPSCHARGENMEKVWRTWKRWKASTRWLKTPYLPRPKASVVTWLTWDYHNFQILQLLASGIRVFVVRLLVPNWILFSLPPPPFFNNNSKNWAFWLALEASYHPCRCFLLYMVHRQQFQL